MRAFDLQPANLLLSSEHHRSSASLKVADFGLSKFIMASSTNQGPSIRTRDSAPHGGAALDEKAGALGDESEPYVMTGETGSPV